MTLKHVKKWAVVVQKIDDDGNKRENIVKSLSRLVVIKSISDRIFN